MTQGFQVMPTLTIPNNQASVTEDEIKLSGILDDLIVPASELSQPEFNGIAVVPDPVTPYVQLSTIVEHLFNNNGLFTLTIQVPSVFSATNDGVEITPLTIGNENFYNLNPIKFSDADDIEFKSFENDDSAFNTTVAFTVTQDLGGGVTNPIDFGQINFTTDIESVPDNPVIQKINTPDGIPSTSSQVQYIGEFTIASTDASESLWFDVVGVPEGVDIYTLDENGEPEFKFTPVPTNNSGGIEKGSLTKSINAPAAANSPQTIRLGIVYNEITFPDDLDLAIRGRSLEGEIIDEVGLEAATAYSSVQPLNIKLSPTQVALDIPNDAAINENDSLTNLLTEISITGDHSDYPDIGTPQNLSDLIDNLNTKNLPFTVEITPSNGAIKDQNGMTLPNTNGVYSIDERSPLNNLTVEIPDNGQVSIKVTVPDLSNTKTGGTNPVVFGEVSGGVDVLPVADKPTLNLTVNDDLTINPDDDNPLVEIGDYTIQPNDDETISLFVDAIPPNSSLIILDDDGETQATFTPTGNGFSTNLNADTFQGTLAVQFNDPPRDLEDFNLNLFATATEPGTNLTAFSDTFNLNIDLPDLIETGDNTETGDSNGTKQLLTYSPGKGAFTFENAKGAILGQELLDDGDGGLTEVGFVITDGNPQDVLTDSKAVFSVLPDGTIIGNQERLTELTQDTGNIHFFKVNGGSIDDLIDGRISSDTVDFNLEVTATDSAYILKWADGLEIGIGLNDKGQSPLALFQGQHEGEILTNQSNEAINVGFSIKSWADYENTVGLFAVNDETGAVTDPLTGETILPGENGYTQIVLSHNLLFEGEAGESGTVALAPSTIYMPFIVADGSVSDGLEGEAQVYFSAIAANSDNFDHVRLLGDNIFAFEDLHGGGDMDFNDIIIEFV